MVSFKKSVLLYGVMLGLGLSVSINTSYALSVLDPACDPAFMSTMKDKAWMETQRETMIAQTIIAKPDSVFDLTCFDGTLGLMKNMTKLTVSGDTSLDPPGGSSPGPLREHLKKYLDSSFKHSLGGGHYPSTTPPPSTTVSKTIGSSTCEVMAKLWQAAKCENANISDIMDLDGFKSSEPRKYAMAACSNTGTWATVPGNTGKWATTTMDPWYTLTTVGAINTVKYPPPTVYFDKMNLFTGNTAPYSQTAPPGGSKKCSAPIKTGIMIGTIPEAVCSNPGCTPNGAAIPKCCPTGTTSGTGCT
ncbi:MAG: hypothetical protein AAB276_01355 [Pseudomonadota bacterium]